MGYTEEMHEDCPTLKRKIPRGSADDKVEREREAASCRLKGKGIFYFQSTTIYVDFFLLFSLISFNLLYYKIFAQSSSILFTLWH